MSQDAELDKLEGEVAGRLALYGEPSPTPERLNLIARNWRIVRDGNLTAFTVAMMLTDLQLALKVARGPKEDSQ